ncbi:MAG: tetratricopeptide repeat protein [Pseudomonadota bacterium]
MTFLRQMVLFSLFLMLATAGCGANRPVKETTLTDKMISSLAAFERDMALGRYQLALADARKAVDISRVLDRDEETALTLNNLGTVQQRIGMVEAAAGSYGESVALSKKTGSDRILAASLNNLAGIVVVDDPDKARVLALEAYELGRSRSWQRVMARALHTRARADLQEGALDDGREWCGRALDLANRANEKSTVAAVKVTLARIESIAGNDAVAIRLVQEALAIDRELADPYAIAMDYMRLAEIQTRAGDETGAETSREKARRILDILGIGGEKD